MKSCGSFCIMFQLLFEKMSGKLLNSLIIFAIISLSFADFFTNPVHLSSLFLTEHKIVEELKKIPRPSEKIQKFLKLQNQVYDELEAAEAPTNLVDSYMDHTVPNPIHVYNVVRRILNELSAITKDLKADDPILKIIKEMADKQGWPTETDMVGVESSLIRIQSVYKLDPYDIAHGILRDRKTHAKITPDEMFRIAEGRFQSPHRIRRHIGPEYAVSIEWAEAALRLAKETGEPEDFKNKIKELLLKLKKLHDENFLPPSEGVGPIEQFFIRKFGNERDSLTSAVLRAEEEIEFAKRDVYPTTFGYDYRIFSALCRGERVEIKFLPKSDGKCMLSDNNDPYLKLQPLKVEMISGIWPLYQFHDVISKKQIKEIQEISKDSFSRAGTEDAKAKDKGEHAITLERTQSYNWIWDQFNPFMARLSKYLDLVTDLHISRSKLTEYKNLVDVIEAEPFQIGIYAPGGHYLPHSDALNRADAFNCSLVPGLIIGNRIATFMFYLSDVEGGGTAFPNLGGVAFPEAGSAAFWFNLKSNGEKDPLALHGACPTLYGVKWVANKWIRSASQMFKKKCGLKEGEWA